MNIQLHREAKVGEIVNKKPMNMKYITEVIKYHMCSGMLCLGKNTSKHTKLGSSSASDTLIYLNQCLYTNILSIYIYIILRQQDVYYIKYKILGNKMYII